MEYFTLNNGMKIPALGFGVYQIENQKQCEELVYQAIQSGYRLIDTASAYGNEEAVGKAIKRSRVPREELFITTKLWVTETNYSLAKQGLEKSLKRPGLDYVDLYIIHQPYNDYYGAWRALEELIEEGKVKAIGIDNFTLERLADFLSFQKTVPAIHLIESNIFYQRHEDYEYLKSKNIQMEAWSPLAGKDKLFNNETMLSLANKYHKSVSQIVLRWIYQRQIISLSKTTKPARMKENLDIFDFEIVDEDMELIKQLDTKQSCFHPRTSAEAVERFIEIAKSFQI